MGIAPSRSEPPMRAFSIQLSAVALALIAAPAPAFAEQCRTLAPLDWLIGDWVAEQEQSTLRESWVVGTSQSWEGRGVETSKAVPASSNAEELRLVQMGDGVYYVAKVAHNPLPVAFRLNECAGGRFVFENPAHDFPKRLEYLRETDDRLVIRVSDGGAKGFTLNFTRVPSSPGTAAAVVAAEDARFAAMIGADAEAMRRWLADDLAYVHSTGQVEDREQLVQSIAGGRLRYLAIEPSERRVRLLGPDAALVEGVARIEARAGDQSVDFPARYTAVYGRVDGGWRLRLWQSLRVPESPVAK
jgi:ketosteroid isomerase-like protein